MKKFLLIATLILSACGANPAQNSAPVTPPAQVQNPAPAAPSAPATANDEVLATINGQPITDSEVTARVGDQLKKVQSQIFEIKRSGVDDVLEEKLIEAEAAKRKISTDELLKKEIDGKIAEPTQAEIESAYQMQKKRFQNKELSEVKNDVVKMIKQSKKASAYGEYVESLKKSAKVKIMMKRPRIDVATDGDPSKGNPKAKVTIVEFSEYQCPFCKKTRPTVDQILSTYKNDVYYVFRDFPLSFHQQARKAAEAANCAGDQGKYWEYSQKLWDNQGNHQPEKLHEYAKAIGLNAQKFSSCLDSGKFADEIEKDIQDGSKAGVSGTPAYFINGIFISGAQPFEKFKAIIDEELAN